MIHAIILLYLSGSIAEQQYISELACDVPVASSTEQFGVYNRFAYVYEDGSSIEYPWGTDTLVVTGADNEIVYTEK